MSGDDWRKDPNRSETTSRYVKGITTNWRQPPLNTIAQNPSTATSSYSHIKHMGTRSSSEFTPGTLVLVWDLTEDHFNTSRSQINRQKEDLLRPDIPGANGFNVFVKTRRVIVIARFIDHYLAVPIYTHKGLGITSKPEMKSEYVSIRNKSDTYNLPQADTDHGCIYTITTISQAGWKAVGPRASAWFTFPQAVNYRSVACFLGKLDPESISKLCELYMMGTKNAVSNTLNRIHPSLWSTAPNSLGSEKQRRLAGGTGTERQRRQGNMNMAQPVKQTYAGATQVQTYSDAATTQTVPGAATGQSSNNTTGFQSLKRPREPGPLDIIFANAAKRGRM